MEITFYQPIKIETTKQEQFIGMFELKATMSFIPPLKMRIRFNSDAHECEQFQAEVEGHRANITKEKESISVDCYPVLYLKNFDGEPEEFFISLSTSCRMMGWNFTFMR